MKLGLGKPKRKDPTLETSSESLSANRLKELCGGNSDLYGAMSRLMFLDPKKINTTLDSVLSDAKTFESQGNKLRAEVFYRVAGGISLSHGDANGVKTYFEKAASIAGEDHPEYKIMARQGDDAVRIALKFYEEFGSVSPSS